MPMTLAAGLLNPAEITQLLVAVGLLLGLAKVLGETAARFRQPSVLGEIMAGVLLGPTLLGALAPGVYAWLFPADGHVAVALEGMITVSVVLLLLVAGLEVDLSSVWRQGKAMVLVSLAGIIFPFATGFGMAWGLPGWFGFEAGGEDRLLPFALFVGIALSITALPVIAKILMDLNLAKSDIGVLVLSSAMVNDLVGWIGFALVLALLPLGAEQAAAGHTGPTGGDLVSTIGLTLLFLALMLTLGRWLVHRALPLIQAHWSWPGGVLMFVIVTALLAGAYTEYLGIHAIFGAFIAGVALGDSNHLRERTRETIHHFIANIFAPLFFASIGLRVSFIKAFDPWLVLLVLVVACAGKILGCYLGAKLAGLSPRESWAVGFGMVARGAMEIILGGLAFQAGLISEELFVAIIVMALVTSLISGPAMEWLLQRRQKRPLGHWLSERQFLPAMKATNAAEAVEELSQQAATLTPMDAETIRQAVWAREQIVRSGIGQGVAVPHARFQNLKAAVVVVGRSPQGVDFDAHDGEPARLICLLLTPQSDPTAQIELLDAVARAFMAPKAREEALQARNFTEFRAALRVAEVTH